MFNQGAALQKSSIKTLCWSAPGLILLPKNQERLTSSLITTTAQHPSPSREVICQMSICVNKHNTHSMQNTDVQTNLFLRLSQKAPICEWLYNKKHFCKRTTTTTTKPMYCDPKACTASVQRAAAFFAKTWKPKMSKFSSFKPLFSKLAEKNKAACRESLKHQCPAWGFIKAFWELHRLVLVQSCLIHIARRGLCPISKLKKGGALRVPVVLGAKVEERKETQKCCFLFESTSVSRQFSFFILILRIQLHTPALFLTWIIGNITVDDSVVGHFLKRSSVERREFCQWDQFLKRKKKR